MNRNELIARLLALPNEIETAEITLLGIEQEMQQARDAIAEVTAGALLDPAQPINGKNEAIREAQLRQFTLQPASWLQEVEAKRNAHRVSLTRLQNEFSALRAVTRLLGSEPCS